RYRTVQALRSEIDEFLEGRLVAAAHYTTFQRFLHFARRNRTAMLVIAIVMLMLIGGTVASVLLVQAATRSQRAEMLSKERRGLDAAVSDVTTLRQSLDASDWETVIDGAEAFRAQHEDWLGAFVTNPPAIVVSSEPDWLVEAVEVPRQVRQLEKQAARRWAEAEFARLPEPSANVDTASLALASQSIDRFEPLLARTDNDVPVAAFAVWMARVEMARADEALKVVSAGGDDTAAIDRARELSLRHESDALSSLARAFLLQPDSPATGAGFLQLAERSLASIGHDDHADEVVMQFHQAWSTFAEHVPALRPRALLGLAKSLLCIACDRDAPFEPGTRAPVMALRCLLQIITPAGEWRDSVKAAVDAMPPDERERMNTSAREGLMIARRLASTGNITAMAAIAGTDLVLDHTPDSVRILRLRHPVSPGLDPPIADVVDDMPLARVLGTNPGPGPGPGSMTIRSAKAWPHDGLTGLAMMIGSAQVWFVYLPDVTRPGQGVRRFVLPSGSWSWRWTISDFNGDRLPDLVAGCPFANDRSDPEHSRIALFMHPAAGDTMTMQLVTTPETISMSTRSQIRSIAASDLDGDGQPELIIARGRWDHFSFEVFTVDRAGNARVIARQLAGHSSPVAVNGPDGTHLLVVCGHTDDALSMSYQVLGQRIPTAPAVWALRNKRLVEVPAPWHELPWVTREGEWQGFAAVDPLDDGYSCVEDIACMRHPVRGGEWDHIRVLMWHGLMPDPDRAAIWRARSRLHHIAGDFYVTSLGLSRRLRDDDLMTIANAGVPVGIPVVNNATTSAALARWLLLFRQPQTAVDTVRRALAAPDLPRPLRLELRALELQALSASGSMGELLATLRQLPVSSPAVPHMLAAANDVLGNTLWYAEVRALLEKWAGAAELTADERQRIRRQLLPIATFEDAINWHSLEFAPGALRYDGKPVSIGAAYIASSADILREMPAQGGDPRYFHCTMGGGTGMLPSPMDERYPRIFRNPDGTLTERGVGSPYAGVAYVRNRGDSVCSMVFRIRGTTFASAFHIGELKLDRDGVDGEFRIGCGGQYGVNTVIMERGLPALDALFDRWLYLEEATAATLGLKRHLLADAKTGEVLGTWTGTMSSLMPPRHCLLGVQLHTDNRTELDIAWMRIRGGVWPMVPLDPTLEDADGDEAQLANLRQTFEKTRNHVPDSITEQCMQRNANAQMAGRTGDAIKALAELISTVDEYYRQTTDRDVRQRMMGFAMWARVESAWLSSGGSSQRFAEALRPVAAGFVRDDDSRVYLAEVFKWWVFAKPQYPPTIEQWEGIGQALYELLAPGRDPGAVLQEWVSGQHPPDYFVRCLAYACYLVRLNPENRANQINLVCHVARTTARNQGFAPMALLCAWLIGPDQAARLSEPGLRIGRLVASLTLLRREEATAFATRADIDELRRIDPRAWYELEALVLRYRRDALHSSMARAARTGWPAIPIERPPD
ncbi:MAG: FG-GAP repeat domain-containing protein, partial [Planctomycetota bacterium]